MIAPVFMFGFERSGTTLLSMMVGAHSKIAVPLSVTGMWFRYEELLDNYGDLDEVSNITRLVQDLLAEERIKLWDTAIDIDEIMGGITENTYSAVIQRFHEVYAKHKSKPYWTNLDIATLDAIPVVRKWFPNAKFIHIVRDGRDVALSHETMPYGASNAWECAQKWLFRVKTNLLLGEVLGADYYHAVRYEDLVLEPENTLRTLCSFIGVEYSSQMLDYPEMVDHKIPKDKRWLWPSLDKAPDRSKVYGWKNNMSALKRAVFESEAGDLLDELGYENTISNRPLLSYIYELWCFLGRGGRFRRFSAKLGIRSTSILEQRWTKKKEN